MKKNLKNAENEILSAFEQAPSLTSSLLKIKIENEIKKKQPIPMTIGAYKAIMEYTPEIITKLKTNNYFIMCVHKTDRLVLLPNVMRSITIHSYKALRKDFVEYTNGGLVSAKHRYLLKWFDFTNSGLDTICGLR